MLLADIIPSFALSLEAQNRTKKTRDTYLEALQRLREFLAAHGYSEELTAIKKFMLEQVRTHTANSAMTRYNALRQFFKWCYEEDEIAINPAEKLRAPKQTETVTPILSENELKRLLKTCEGKSFADRRNTAIIRVFLDTGLRRSELANLTLEQVDLTERVIIVYGKGRKYRLVPIGIKTTQALDKYLRMRKSHPHAGLPNLWVGQLGAMTHNGIYHTLVKLAEEAGIKEFHPHMFRHTFAHEFLKAGGGETEAMTIAGWKSRNLLDRYGAAGKAERARSSHKLYSPGDKL